MRAPDQVCQQCFRWTGWRTTRWRPACSKSKTTSSPGTRPSVLQSSERNIGCLELSQSCLHAAPKLSQMYPKVFNKVPCSQVSKGCLKMTKDVDIITPQILPSEDGPPAYRDSSLREGKALRLKNSICKSLVPGEGGPQGMHCKVSSSLVIFNRYLAPAQSSNLMAWRSKSAGGLS